MSEPLALHVIRPYPNADEYLKHEAWTMDTRTMLLIGEAELPPGTAVMLEVTLGDGSRPIRAEARVLANVEPRGARPGGLRVRFKRYGASTKTFLDRAVELSDRPSLRPPEPSPPSPENGSTPGTTPSTPEAAGTSDAASPAPADTAAVTTAPDYTERRRRALEALRTRANQLTELPVPDERELLLERLRQRHQSEDATTLFRISGNRLDG